MLVSLVFIFACVVFATVPQKINYQGYLADGSGTPIISTTPLKITIKIYSSASTAIHLWMATCSIRVNDGMFNVTLGSPDYLGANKEIPYTVFNGDVRWLGTSVSGEPEMTSRKKYTSVAYSFKQDVEYSIKIQGGNLSC